ncbi:hypothetical protein SAMN05444008_111144 [Cnuella takakiae]|uniref:Uncharacterized protein n=1 Tax=Cnuella takakiae TaxID=1302690 RepID=A0A1M5DZI5_9BACT|nr:hypothetical protein [Cnuella takakiae]SHF72379.1 hypothetical protein SAMN05444008_111144 [Cnuella takakiae]
MLHPGSCKPSRSIFYIYEPDQVQFSVFFSLARKNRKINLPVSEMGEKEF